MSKLYESLLSQKKAVDSSWDRLVNNRERDWGLFGHDIGLHPLNLAIGGLIPTKVTTIGARSGTGKTSILTAIAEGAARVLNGRRAELCVFSWEMQPEYLVDRYICSKTGLTLRGLNQGAKLILPDFFNGKLKEAYNQAQKLPAIYQTHSTDINVVRAVSKEFVETCKEKSKIEGIEILPVIIIDYLNMAQFEAMGLRTYGIGDFMNGFKQLCNELRTAGIIFAQISRTTDRENRVPDRADFADSSAIENASDNLIVLYRPEYHGVATVKDPQTELDVDSEGKLLIRVLKGRDYGIGDFLTSCDIRHFRFWDLNQEWNYPYWLDYASEEFWLKHFGFEKK